MIEVEMPPEFSVGKCRRCGEDGQLISGLHRECGVRMVMGSVKCQQGLCPDCGDDPKLTKRQAAQAALEYFRNKCTCADHGPHLCPVHSP